MLTWLGSTYIGKMISVFLISMLPIVELRGAIPFGVSMDLPILVTFLLGVAGNMVPVPFIILFLRCIFDWMMYCLPHIAHESPGLHLRKALLHGLTCHIHQSAHRGIQFTEAVHARRIRIVAVQIGGDIHIDDVTGTQHNIL